MKHILNNMSEEEKNSIREQHTGGMKVMTENFSKLLNSKLGDAKPFLNEEQFTFKGKSVKMYSDVEQTKESLKGTIVNEPIKNEDEITIPLQGGMILKKSCKESAFFQPTMLKTSRYGMGKVLYNKNLNNAIDVNFCNSSRNMNFSSNDMDSNEDYV